MTWFRIVGLLMLYVSLAHLAGCDVQVQTFPPGQAPPPGKKTLQFCAGDSAYSQSRLFSATIAKLESSDAGCVSVLLDALHRQHYESSVAEASVRFLERTSFSSRRAIDPELARAALLALSYLMQIGPGQSGPRPLISDFAESIRYQVAKGDAESKHLATNLLSVLREDRDLELFSRNIQQGDDALVAVSLFAIANNCSERAATELKLLLRAKVVANYLAKYRGKESITQVVSRDCPAGMP